MAANYLFIGDSFVKWLFHYKRAQGKPFLVGDKEVEMWGGLTDSKNARLNDVRLNEIYMTAPVVLLLLLLLLSTLQCYSSIW